MVMKTTGENIKSYLELKRSGIKQLEEIAKEQKANMIRCEANLLPRSLLNEGCQSRKEIKYKKNKMEDNLCKYIDIKIKYSRSLQHLKYKKKTLKKEINQIISSRELENNTNKDRLTKIIIYKYVQGHSCRKIALKMNLNKITVNRYFNTKMQ